MSEGPKRENPAKTPRRYTPSDAAQDSKNVPIDEESNASETPADPGSTPGPVKNPKP
jgi:hypothetical protein